MNAEHRHEPFTTVVVCRCGATLEGVAPSPDALRAALEYALQRQVDLGTFSALRADEIIGDVYAALEPQEPVPVTGKGLRNRGIVAYPTGEGQRAIDRETRRPVAPEEP
jgi:hypothetical protein